MSKNNIVQNINEMMKSLNEKICQPELAHNFFIFAELLKNGDLYDVIMDAYLIAKYNEDDLGFQPCSKNDLIKRWNMIINKL